LYIISNIQHYISGPFNLRVYTRQNNERCNIRSDIRAYSNHSWLKFILFKKIVIHLSFSKTFFILFCTFDFSHCTYWEVCYSYLVLTMFGLCQSGIIHFQRSPFLYFNIFWYYNVECNVCIIKPFVSNRRISEHDRTYLGELDTLKLVYVFFFVQSLFATQYIYYLQRFNAKEVGVVTYFIILNIKK